jgi:hypothetical protein
MEGDQRKATLMYEVLAPPMTQGALKGKKMEATYIWQIATLWGR